MCDIHIEKIGNMTVVECQGRIARSDAAFRLRDAVISQTIPLTHELLAQMLGTRRSSVTVSAGMLQKAGIIAHTRGEVKILDRGKLEEVACECYSIMLRQIKTWQGDSK